MNMISRAKHPPAELAPAFATQHEPPAADSTAPAPAPRTPRLAIALIAAGAFGVEMAVSARYGYVRDELYFLAAGQHLAFGYVDQPLLTPLLARISALATGNTLVGLRVLPALALAALVVLTAAMSRLLGAGRTGQILAALATATCAEYLGAMHELTTTTPDFVFWAVTLLLVTRLLASQDPRWWVAIGGCVGVASEAKWNIGFLAAALGAGFLATDARRLLRSRYLLLGCAIVIGLQFLLGGKAYYPGGVYTFLFAAGAVPLERRLAARSPLTARIRPAARTALAMLVSGAIGALVAIPVLPARVLHTVPLQKINYDLAETISWPQQVALVARDYDSLPASERRRTTILTGNYGEAGAIDRYGPGLGLPQVYSGANNFWLWGPPPVADTAAIAVNIDPALLRREFAHVRRISTFWNGLGVSDDEQGAPIYLATGLRSSWAQAWPAFRDYS